MDKGKEKRKRGEKESERARKRKVIRGGEEGEQEEEEEEDVVAVATEEEVEEFFAILKRMQTAANYFGKGNGERWRAAIEADVVGDVIDGDHGKEGEIIAKSPGAEEVAAAVVDEEAEEECGVLDLNATPVAEANGA